MIFLKQTISLGVVTAALLTSCNTAFSAQLEILASETETVTGGNDIQQLKKLALSTGWEFTRNKITDLYLKDLGVNRIRCINIDSFPGEFDEQGAYKIHGHMTTRLDHHLKTCTEVGAIPHLVIGPFMPKALTRRAETTQIENKGIMGNVGVSGRIYGPVDYTLYRNYFVALFEHVLVTKGITNAVFEAYNEPDIGGGFIYETPVAPGRGSKEAYDNLFKNYRTIAEAAALFEQNHPGQRVVLGGPALAWAFTFKFGAFNWGNRFVEDCAKNNLKLDFIGVHYYGNISPIRGDTNEEYNAYPSFLQMFAELNAAIAEHKPGLPIYMSEYGPSFDVTSRPQAMINGNHTGAAWNMAFLKAMLETGIDAAAYLVTTDIARKDKGHEQLNNVWGWCSYFVNPEAYGYPYPKAPYHTYKMISDLQGTRVKLNREGGNTDALATVDTKQKTLQLLLWNYAADIPETSLAIDRSVPETLTIKIHQASDLFGTNPQMISKLIDAEHGNILRLRESSQPLTWQAAHPAITKHGAVALAGDTLVINFTMPPSSVAMIELGPDPDFPTPQIPYSEEAARLLQVGRQKMKTQEHGQAIEAFQAAQAIPAAAAYQKSDALCQLLGCARLRGDQTSLLETSLALIALKDADPTHLSHALIAAAEQYRHRQDLKKSSELCRRILTISFNRYDRMRAELCLGYNLMDQKKYDDAVAMFSEVHKQDYFGGRHFRVPAYLATGMCRFKQKDYEGAIAAYQSVLTNQDIQGEGSELYRLFAVNRIARCYLASGEPEKARKILEDAGEFPAEIPYDL
ncbi:MAG: tetratricopeptide repeat protein [Pirellulaceae bacterium]|nr:tetratricopeptide repeat protein [Pirellulaceae bacterium]